MTNYEKIMKMTQEEFADFMLNTETLIKEKIMEQYVAYSIEGKIKNWLNDEEIFKPYLRSVCMSEIKYGNIGEETDLTLSFGEPLYVGDVVELFNMEINFNLGFHIIVKSEGDSFVFGYKTLKFKNGIDNRHNPKLQIKKVKSYEDLKHGETIRGAIIAIFHE